MDILESKVDGPCLRMGGSDLGAPPELCTFTITSRVGKRMKLRAETLSDARRWIMVLQAASKGGVPILRASQDITSPPQLLADTTTTDATTQQVAGSEEDAATATGGESSTTAATAEVGVTMKKEATAQQPWEAVADDQGQTYYWNTSTGETVWEPPPALADTTPPAEQQATPSNIFLSASAEVEVSKNQETATTESVLSLSSPSGSAHGPVQRNFDCLFSPGEKRMFEAKTPSPTSAVPDAVLVTLNTAPPNPPASTLPAPNARRIFTAQF
jgi:hypothetical protein